ncbi:hypothetical protein DXG01_012791 [Tephrocybe rancida]|nr:hypothetical protein DXG01_012791 [Tephrocybe rancida]
MLRSTVSQLCSRADQKSRSLFHTSAALSFKTHKKFGGDGSSRTRLTKDLQSKSGSRASNLEVAPRSTSTNGPKFAKKPVKRPVVRGGRPISRVIPTKRDFPREPLPHEGRELDRPADWPPSSPSFRRGRHNDRNGKWGGENNNREQRSRDRGDGSQMGRRNSFSDRPRHSEGVFIDRRPFTADRGRGEQDIRFGQNFADRKPYNSERGQSTQWTGQQPYRDGPHRSGGQYSDRKAYIPNEDRGNTTEKWAPLCDSVPSSGKLFADKNNFREGRERGNEREGREGRDNFRPFAEQNEGRPRSVIWQGQNHLDQARTQKQGYDTPRRDTQSSAKSSNSVPIISELSDASTTTRPDTTELATTFTSPPLMPGILSCLTDIIGPGASPTPIQALSLKWLLNDAGQANAQSGWKQFLLASETGSGKSIAYLLPVLQNLKLSEMSAAASPPSMSAQETPAGPKRPLNPRALILAPTHELSRQLSGFAKSLLHEVKLRVLCASRANMRSTKEHDATARQMVSQIKSNDASGEFQMKERSGFPVDVVVGTPMKLLEMIRGRGWDRKEFDAEEVPENPDELGPKPRRGRDKIVGFGKWRSKPEIGLANVEWVVVDEADVLFDPDFQETTRQLLADISAARGHPIPPTAAPPVSPHPSSASATTPTPTPLEYPFNLVLTSATIPASLATYLDTNHPKLMRLASPRLHHLPKTLQTEYVNWSGGNKLADIERRIRRVWAEDASTVSVHGDAQQLSKVLIFCNRSSKVEELGTYLEERGIKNVGLSSTSEQRKRGSNHHLDGFLRVLEGKESEDAASLESEILSPVASEVLSDPKSHPHVMITTSLLSRGLDFSPSIKHVFIVDEPRNMIDFLHRAGRAGRAGEKGKVVVFGKMKGRGSSSAKDVRKKVGSLIAH